MIYSIVFTRPPISVNNNSNHIDYEKELLNLMKLKYPKRDGEKVSFKRDERLYVQVFYFCKHRCNRDIDNILKYIIDSFRKYLYADDKQIGYVLSQSIILKDNQTIPIDLDIMDDDASIILDFLQSTDRNWECCTYFECGNMNDNFHHFNLEEVWK